MAELAGFEPATLCLEGRCSIHLSYSPKLCAGGAGSVGTLKLRLGVFSGSGLPGLALPTTERPTPNPRAA